MSDPKPLSAEEVVRDAFTNGIPGSADKAGWVELRRCVFDVLVALEAERARADAAETALKSYTREARKCQASFTADPPVDCDWPHCGCDPHAERVMDGLRASGWRTPDEFREQVARADAAERRANAYERVLNEIAQEGCGCDEGIPYRCPSCRANDLDLDQRSDVEDWQECAGHLALALKNTIPPEERMTEVREALDEFERLAGEATKGVEL